MFNSVKSDLTQQRWMIILYVDAICIYEVYISSMCTEVKWVFKKSMGFELSKGWCLFLLFWYCVTISCLSTFDLYCLLDCYGVALAWIFLIRAWIMGIYFTIWISYWEVWSGHLDQYLFSWLNLMQHVYCIV